MTLRVLPFPILLGCGVLFVSGLNGLIGAEPVAGGRKEFPVEPLTRYALSFVAEQPEGSAARWEVRTRTAGGLLPFDGVFAADWQKLREGRHLYRHEILTPRDASTLEFLVAPPEAAIRVEEMRLEKITDKNLMLNHDFSAGPENYSGWNTTDRAELVDDGTGQRVLKCAPDGYGVSDPIPVESGGTYRLTGESAPGVRILLYDRDHLAVGILFETGYSVKDDPEIVIPPDVAFLRMEYCDGRENRSPVIRQVGLEKTKEGPKGPVESFPPYPGEIVVRANASLPEVRAGRELQHWIRKISGREIPLLAEPSPLDRMRIFVGREWAEKRFGSDLETLKGSDGFAIRKADGAIYVFGARPAGSLFGAIRLLEDNSDLIFARPDRKYGAVFTKNPDLTFANANRILRPAFAYRMSHALSAETFDDGIWQGRLGLNTSPRLYNGFRRREMGGAPSFEDNYMGTIARVPEFAFEKASREHPEFFAMVDGTRRILPKGYICYTAPGVAEALAEGLRNVVETHADRGEPVEFLQIRTRDGWLVCSCPECREPILLPDGSRLEPKAFTSDKDPLFFSTRMTQMLNRVGEELARTHPEITLTVPAYLYASEPPAIPHGASLAPMFCAYDLCSIRFPILDGGNNHFADGRKWEEKFREYLRRTTGGRKLSMFSYHYANGFSAVADSAREDWLAMARTGGAYQVHLDGFSRDAPGQTGINTWDYDAPEKWIMSRLLWEPELDAQTLREEYCRRAYHEAAPEMIAFYNGIREAWKNPAIKLGVNCHTPGSVLFDQFIVKTGQEKALRDLLVKAEKKTENADSRRLIQRVQAAFDQLAGTLQRVYIPHVAESTAEWDLPESTFWLQALRMEDFKKVSNGVDYERAPATQPTSVFLMRDNDNLYVRFDAGQAEASDRVEVVLEAARHTTRYYFGLDRTGKPFSLRNFSDWESSLWSGKVAPTADGYAAMFRIPFSVMENLDVSSSEFQFLAKFARMSEGPGGLQESSVTGYSITRTHYLNYWTTLSVRKNP